MDRCSGIGSTPMCTHFGNYTNESICYFCSAEQSCIESDKESEEE